MRAPLLALALLAAGCTFTPSLSGYEPKSAADCPGQKACGWRCLEVDDPAAGCGPATCLPCPGGPLNTVPVCGAGQACAVACLPGFAAADGDPAGGCAVDVRADAANCGAIGHACPAGVACSEGTCQVAPATEVAATGAAPRGLALAGTTFYWAVDPPVAGGQPPAGALRSAPGGGGAATVATRLGHPTFVRAAGGPPVAVAGTDPDDDTIGLSWLLDPSLVDPGTGEATVLTRGGGSWGALVTGVALVPDWLVTSTSDGVPGDSSNYVESASYDGNASSVTGVNGGDPILALGEGGAGSAGTPLLWAAFQGGVSRLEDLADGWAYDVVSGGGIYFDALARRPVPARVAAVPGAAPTDPLAVWFVDLTDGSVWKGLTQGRDGPPPWRVVQGSGPRTAMDLASDDAGVVWSDYDAGEIWAAGADDQPHRLASGVKPWAIALAGGRVYFTDVAAQAIRSVPR